MSIETRMICSVLEVWPNSDLFDNISTRLGGLAGICRYGALQYDRVGNDERFRDCMRKGHWGMLEHGGATALLVCNRGVTHELVRHRLCSFLQESTRYRDYEKDGITLRSVMFRDAGLEPGTLDDYEAACLAAYKVMVRKEGGRDLARGMLPNWLSASIVMTANWRQWIHVIQQRTGSGVHPDMKATMEEARRELTTVWPDLSLIHI